MIRKPVIVPALPGRPRKNDALFMYGAVHQGIKTFVYEQSGTEIVHGPSCVPKNEIMLDQCINDNIPVYERRSGGGTVVLSSGMIIIVVTGQKNGIENPLQIFKIIHTSLITVLKKHGIDTVVERGISDLAIGDKKVLGSSLYMGKKPPFFYYQSSLLVDADLFLMDRYLKHPPREPDYRSGRDHGTFCTTLHKEGFRYSVSEILFWFENELSLEIEQNMNSGY
jgi:lipoate-protein ligase A